MTCKIPDAPASKREPLSSLISRCCRSYARSQGRPLVFPTCYLGPTPRPMNMIGSGSKIQHLKTKALFRLKKPVAPTSPILGELQQELLFMASMGNVPYLPWYMVPVSSRHFLLVPFYRQKHAFKSKIWGDFGLFHRYLNMLPWSDPTALVTVQLMT